MRKTLGLIILLAVVVYAAPVQEVISFQGRLLEGGTPVEGTRDIHFYLYDVAAGGTDIWDENHIDVPVEGGLFNVELGATSTFDAAGVDFTEQYWLTFSVEGGAEVTPRYKLTGTPYSMADGDWVIDGDNVYHDNGRVAVNTSSTSEAILHVQGPASGSLNSVRITGSSDTYSALGIYGANQNGIYITDPIGDGIFITGSDERGIYVTSATQEAGYFDGDVRVVGSYLDSDGNAGTAGQILSSTGTGTDWISGGSGGGLWTDGGSYIYPNNNTNIIANDASDTRDIEVNMPGSSKWYGLYVDNTSTGYDADSYTSGYTKSAIAANVDDAGIRQCAIIAWSALTDDSSASVLGANTDGTVWGALGYKYTGTEYSAFFNDMTYIGTQTSIGQPAAATSAELTIYDPDAAAIDIMNDDETWRITTPILNNLHFHNIGGPSNVLVLEAGTGQVGINEGNPDAGLHITGSGYPGSFIICETGTGEDAGIRLHEGATDKWHLLFEGSTEDFEIRNGDYEPYLTIDQTTGYVGIGTTSPSGMLTISSDIVGLSGGLNLNRDADDWYIYQDGAEGLRFRDDANDAVVIDSAGNVGINETSPEIILHVKQQESGEGIRFENTTTTDHWDIGIAGTNNLWFQYNGTLKSWVDETDGSWDTSDRRLKRDIEPIEGVLDEVMRLEPVSYYWKDDQNPTRRSIGLIAQDVKAVFPDAAQMEDSYGYYGINYNYISVLTLQGLIELKSEYESTIENQETRLETLESEIELLKAEIKSLKNKE